MSITQKDLGVGVGLRSEHHADFLGPAPKIVSWVEVISENFLPRPGQPFNRSFQTLEKIRENLPVALHGVSMSLGSAGPINHDYLNRLKRLVDRIDPFIVSDHLCWTGVAGKNLHDLLPLPHTEEAIHVVSSKILEVQNFLRRPILIENASSYVEFEGSQMPEWQFLSEIAERSCCGILLDVNNIFVNATNHGFDPFEYLKAVPAERVAQIHLAGHSEQDGFLIDTHDAPVRDEVWDLYRAAHRLFGNRSTMIERDSNIPEWRELSRELEIIHRIRQEGGLHEAPRAAASL